MHTDAAVGGRGPRCSYLRAAKGFRPSAILIQRLVSARVAGPVHFRNTIRVSRVQRGEAESLVRQLAEVDCRPVRRSRCRWSAPLVVLRVGWRKVDEWKTILVPSGDQLGRSAFISAGTSCRRSLPLALTANNVDWQPPLRNGPMPCLANTSWLPSGDHLGDSLFPLAAVVHGIRALDHVNSSSVISPDPQVEDEDDR